MQSENSKLATEDRESRASPPELKVYIPAFIAAGICIALQRSILLSFFFLVPLGFAAFRHGYKITWTASVLAILGNSILLVGTAVSRGIPLAATTMSQIHFAALVLIFAWMIVPPPSFAAVPFSVRFVIGSSLGPVMFIILFLRIMAAPWFYDYVAGLLNNLILQNPRMAIMDTEIIMQGIRGFLLRGGSLVACILIFVLSRQLSVFLTRIIPGKTRNLSESFKDFLRRLNSLEAFRVHSALIWVLSSSLLLVILTRRVGLEAPEILLWNILVLCAILYFAQGLGILQAFLSRPSISPFFKLTFLILIVVMFFSPVLNMALIICFVLLGIAENWVSLRTPKKDSSPSTPEG